MTRQGDDPQLSVLVVCHNQVAMLPAALASIDAQRSYRSIEVVIADDASTDGTRELAESWARTSAHRVRILDPEPQLGIMHNYRRAFAACRGDYIAVLEGDDEWLTADKLELQAEALDRHPDWSMVATRAIRDEVDLGVATLFPTVESNVLEPAYSLPQLADDNWVGTFSVCMYRRSLLAQLPDAVFDLDAADWIITMMMARHGDVGLVPVAGTRYRVHSGGQWSGVKQSDQLARLRDALPGYEELLGERSSVGLARWRRLIEEILASTPTAELPTKDAHHTIPAVPDLPLPRVFEPSPEVSVVLATHDSASTVLAAVQSILAQRSRRLELIVVDDASTDNTVATLATVHDERLRIVRLGTSLGAAVALNLAIQQSRAPWIAITEAGHVWGPDRLDFLSSAAGEDLVAVVTARDSFESSAILARSLMRDGDVLEHGTALIARATLERIGLFDPRLRHRFELDLILRLASAGSLTCVMPACLKATPTAEDVANPALVVAEDLLVNERWAASLDKTTTEAVFGPELASRTHLGPIELACAVALIQFRTPGRRHTANALSGALTLHRLLGNPEARLLMRAHLRLNEAAVSDLLRIATAEAATQVTPVGLTPLHQITTSELARTVLRRGAGRLRRLVRPRR